MAYASIYDLSKRWNLPSCCASLQCPCDATSLFGAHGISQLAPQGLVAFSWIAAYMRHLRRWVNHLYSAEVEGSFSRNSLASS